MKTDVVKFKCSKCGNEEHHLVKVEDNVEITDLGLFGNRFGKRST